MPNAFSEQYTRWGLPTDAKTRFGKGRIFDIKYFPDGNKIAVATTVGTWIYDVQTGTAIDLLPARTGYVNSVAFSPDGKRFATGGGSDGRIELWDAQTGENRAVLVGHDDDVTSVAFSPKAQVLVSGSYDGDGSVMGCPHKRTFKNTQRTWRCRALHSIFSGGARRLRVGQGMVR